jgi:hypothetical protein
MSGATAATWLARLGVAPRHRARSCCLASMAADAAQRVVTGNSFAFPWARSCSFFATKTQAVLVNARRPARGRAQHARLKLHKARECHKARQPDTGHLSRSQRASPLVPLRSSPASAATYIHRDISRRSRPARALQLRVHAPLRELCTQRHAVWHCWATSRFTSTSRRASPRTCPGRATDQARSRSTGPRFVLGCGRDLSGKRLCR